MLEDRLRFLPGVPLANQAIDYGLGVCAVHMAAGFGPSNHAQVQSVLCGEGFLRELRLSELFEYRRVDQGAFRASERLLRWWRRALRGRLDARGSFSFDNAGGGAGTRWYPLRLLAQFLFPPLSPALLRLECAFAFRFCDG